MTHKKIAAIIPARMASTRYPGKPLLAINGLPMVEHVRRRVMLAKGFSDVIVATCDDVIKEKIESYGGNVIMTSPDHPGATDRVAEAARQIDCTHVVNVQGDEILIVPAELEKLTAAIKNDSNSVAWNAIGHINSKDELSDPSIVKCVVSISDRLLFCSRNFSQLPLLNGFDPVRIVLGILGYEKEFLLNYSGLKRSPAELLERIDQNRVIENDFIMQGVLFDKGYPGINEPREVELISRYLSDDNKQKSIFEKILKES